MAGKTSATSCDYCAYYQEDDDTGLCICKMSLDEDEMLHFLKGKFNNCPYFKPYDEYSIVRKQI
ncbi:MAG: hypothetical protein DBX61_09360 [Clostridiales bacterium]|nr:MAG: hypothetical protein DBX61_09360 [Clostridiales bacterium]